MSLSSSGEVGPFSVREKISEGVVGKWVGKSDEKPVEPGWVPFTPKVDKMVGLVVLPGVV